MTQNTQRNGRFYLQFIGMKGVILFPALTTPCIVDKSGRMNVIAAVNEKAFAWMRDVNGYTQAPGSMITEFSATKFHAHLLLVPWGNGHSRGYDADADPRACQSFYTAINSWSNTIFGGLDKCIEAFRNKETSGPSFSGYYLGRIGDDDTPVALHGPQGQKPFGILAGSSCAMHKAAGYEHLFQLSFRNFPAAAEDQGTAGKLYELVWVNVPHAPEDPDHQYENPTDTMLVRNFEHNINMDGGRRVLEPNIGTSPQKIQTDADRGQEDLNLYRLRSGKVGHAERQTGDRAQTEPPGGIQESGQSGQLIYAYHPVYFKHDPESIGVIADLHLSSRQSLYKCVNAQVIPGAPESDSPCIGQTAHESLRSAGDLLLSLGESSDMILILGDMIDFKYNLDPANCQKEISRAAQLWQFLDYRRNVGMPGNRSRYYPQNLDGLLAMQLILEQYDRHGKPVFMITGNREGWLHPHGVSARMSPLRTPFLGARFKINPGVASDHNLSHYETALLFGERFNETGLPNNFDPSAMDWIYQVFSPWRDFYVETDKINLCCLGWGSKEEYLPSFVLSGFSNVNSRASGAISDAQLALVRNFLPDAESKRNILASHFTYAAYAGDHPFMDGDGNMVVQSIIQTGSLSAEDPENQGSFKLNMREVLDMLESRKIHFTLSGHAHRPAAHAFTGEHREKGVVRRHVSVPPCVRPEDEPLLSSHLLPEQHAVSLVAGSAGPMSYQNIQGEFLHLGMDSPQALRLDLSQSPALAEFKRWNSNGREKPRLAALVSMLHSQRKAHIFDSWKNFFERYQISIGFEDSLGHYLATAKITEKTKRIFQGTPVNSFKLYVCSQSNPGDWKHLSVYFSSYYERYNLLSGMVDDDSHGLIENVFGKNNVLYFISIGLGVDYVKDRKCSGILEKYYNMSSKLCYPVQSVSKKPLTTSNQWMVKIAFDSGPDYDALKMNFEEYCH